MIIGAQQYQHPTGLQGHGFQVQFRSQQMGQQGMGMGQQGMGMGQQGMGMGQQGMGMGQQGMGMGQQGQTMGGANQWGGVQPQQWRSGQTLSHAQQLPSLQVHASTCTHHMM